MRLDQYIYETYHMRSRSYAASLIMEGKVKIKDKVITKAGFQIKAKDYPYIYLKEDLAYVSWGACKILKAFDCFNINLKDRVVLDIGSSTGGFTQVALEKGAKLVYAVDVGENQLDYSLRTHQQVISLEKTNARILNNTFFTQGIPEFVLIDVSFISLKLIFPTLKSLNIQEGIILIKPQFEVGKEIPHFDGVVKEPKYWDLAIQKVKEYAQENQFIIYDIIESPSQNIKKKNKEYLAWLKTNHTNFL